MHMWAEPAMGDGNAIQIVTNQQCFFQLLIHIFKSLLFLIMEKSFILAVPNNLSSRLCAAPFVIFEIEGFLLHKASLVSTYVGL